MTLAKWGQNIINKFGVLKKLILERIHTNPMIKAMVIMVVGCFILFGLIFGYKFVKILLMPAPQAPVVSVSATQAKFQEWQPKRRALGTVRAIQGVDMTTELAGMVKKIHLKPGRKVKAGDLLVELNIDSEVAQLKALRALAELADINYKRDKGQFAIHAISQAALDASRADLQNKKAQAAQQEAIIAKKMIRAPFDGVLGISFVNLGQYLNTGDKIITLQSLDPIYIDFFLPQKDLSVLKVGQKIYFKTDTYPDTSFSGTITSIDPKLDSSTRNIQVEATVANGEAKLYPGMFGEMSIYVGSSQKHLTLPKTAISFNPFGEIVYIVRETEKDKKGKPVLTVKQSFVTVGESRGDQIAILKGLEEGALVVTAGQQKLRNGAHVAINNSVVPDADPAPHLIDE